MTRQVTLAGHKETAMTPLDWWWLPKLLLVVGMVLELLAHLLEMLRW